MATGEYRNLFFNEDGTFTEQAAIKIAMAMFGENELKNAVARAKKEGASKQNEQFVKRADKKPEITARNPGKKGSPLDAGTMQFMQDMMPKKDVYSARAV
jgi:hypothetical protein